MPLRALDAEDLRVINVKVASPAALMIAKLFKLDERMAGSKPDRILAKDASDVLRMLRYNDAIVIGESLRAFSDAAIGFGTNETAIKFLRAQHQMRVSPMIELAVGYHREYEIAEQIRVSFRMLMQRLLGGYGVAPATT